jgi:hypothetical protein
VRVAYAGIETLTFNQYIDLDTGKTLTAEPGRVYDIAPASGRVVPEVPEPWFTPVEPKALEAGPADEPAPETAENFTSGPDPEEPEG